VGRAFGLVFLPCQLHFFSLNVDVCAREETKSCKYTVCSVNDGGSARTADERPNENACDSLRIIRARSRSE
jgi:hypothetical protein